MTTIHQHTFGTGKPIVLVHGWAMHSGIWQGFAQQLAQHYQVTCIDLPGHGGSEKITPYTLEQIGDTLVNAVTDERSCWLGWSLGATVVLDIARRYPERVDALILLSGNPCFVQKSHETLAGQWPGMKTLLLEQFASQLAENCMLALVRFLSLQVQGLANSKGFLQQLKTAASKYPAPDAETLQGGLDILKHADLRTALADIDKPVLTLLGGRDTLVPAAVGQAMQQQLPKMQLHCIGQAAHAPFLSHRLETVAIISHFMDELGRLSFDKPKLRQSFSAASATYDSVAQLQRTVGQSLLKIADTEYLGGTLLDIGCGTGFLTGELLALSLCTSVIALDIALPMLHITRHKLPDNGNVHYVCADAEALPLAEHSIDHVFSNLALQWCNHLYTVFNDIRRVLKPGGQLAFSTFGAHTLQELKAAWATVDGYSHVNDFYTQDDIGCLLRQAGFININTRSTTYLPRYGSVLALMRELKGLGAHNVLAGRNRQLTTKTAMQNMIAAYQTASVDGPVSATFEVITVTASR